jgi:hypothetical protein
MSTRTMLSLRRAASWETDHEAFVGIVCVSVTMSA